MEDIEELKNKVKELETEVSHRLHMMRVFRNLYHEITEEIKN